MIHPMAMPTDNGELSFESCAFCPTEKRADSLYKCPRCTAFYCSVRCFRCQKHSKCSEQFYHGECEQFAAQADESSSASSSSATMSSPKIAPFEQYMKKEQAEQLKGGKAGKRRVNPQIAVRADEEILFDSDDEPEYLSKIAASTLEQFGQAMDDEELNRRLLGAGLPLGMEEADEGKPYPTDTQEHLEQLYQQLTDEEKRKFTELAEGMFQDEFQAITNCFAKKTKR